MPRFEAGSKVYKSKHSGEYKIVEVENAHNIWIEFLSTGTVKKVEHSSLHSNTVKDYEYPSVQGVGIVGEDEAKKPKGRAYSVWSDMLLRCYDPTSKSYFMYGGRGVTVCDDWLRYGNFKKWFDEKYIQGFELDKDLLPEGLGLQYSPENCIFLPKKVNSYLGFARKDRDLPTGVSQCKKSSKYYAYIKYSATGNRKNLGGYNSPEKAFEVYKREKEKDLYEVIKIWDKEGILSEEVKSLLLNLQIKPFPV